MKNTIPYLFLTLLFLYSCKSRKEADLVLLNGKIYTVDSVFSIQECLVINEGKIVYTGTKTGLENFNPKQILDLKGQYVYPGFIDAHCHFYNYGLSLNQVDLTGTTSFEEVLEKTKTFAAEHKEGWIQGRGWDQNDWANKDFPDKKALDNLFPDQAVFLTRIDGHAAIANSQALKLAGINKTTPVNGGVIEKNSKGELTGILIDNAIDLLKKAIPTPNESEMRQALLLAQKNCFQVGLTTIDDAGLEKKVIDVIEKLQNEQELLMRMYVMLTPDSINLDHYLKKGPVKTDNLNIRSFKIYADGALGSRGACLIKPYSDKPSQTGFLLEQPEYFRKMAKLMFENNFQMNTHSIGDSANRFALNVYEEILPEDNDKRWRIEHAQVVHTNDLEKFKQLKVIPSIQPTHATSDMYWAVERLGINRVKTAYAYTDLLQMAGLVAAGSDFPIESINPLYGFYAAVARKDHKGYPEGGFQIENALTREEALKAMTIWAAYSNFEEKEKGSLEKGKFADFVILNKDLMIMDINEIPTLKINSTYIAGKKVFNRDN